MSSGVIAVNGESIVEKSGPRLMLIKYEVTQYHCNFFLGGGSGSNILSNSQIRTQDDWMRSTKASNSVYFWQMYLEFDQTALKSVLVRSSCCGIHTLFKSDLYNVEISLTCLW